MASQCYFPAFCKKTFLAFVGKQSRAAEQFPFFPFGKGHVRPLGNVSEFNVLDTYALELFHLVSGGFDHAADLAVLPFREDDGKLTGGNAGDFGRFGLVTVEDLHSGGHTGKFGIFDGTVDFDDVFLLVLVAGMHEPVGEAPVVGEDEEAYGILVETSDGEHAFRDVDDVHDAGIALRDAGRNDATGLVHLVIDEFLDFADGLVPDFDLVDSGYDRHADGRHLAVDLHEAAGDEFLGLTAGRYSGTGKVFLKADFATFAKFFFEFDMVHVGGFSERFWNFSGLPVFGDDARFFDELDTELRQHLVFGEVAERDHVAPVGLGGSEEEVGMERRYFCSSDLRPLESRLIYERSRGMSFGVLEEGSARPSGGLFGFSQIPELGNVHRLVRVPFFSERKVEYGGYDEAVGGLLQDARTVRESQVGVAERFHFAFGDVPYVGRNEYVGGFEPEASGVADYRSSETSREADPGHEARESPSSEKQGHGMHLLGGMDFKAFGRDPYGRKRSVVRKVPETGKRIFHEKPREPVEGEEAVGTVAEVGHRKPRGFRGGYGERKGRKVGF